jgi:hypothetical protein
LNLPLNQLLNCGQRTLLDIQNDAPKEGNWPHPHPILVVHLACSKISVTLHFMVQASNFDPDLTEHSPPIPRTSYTMHKITSIPAENQSKYLRIDHHLVMLLASRELS